MVSRRWGSRFRADATRKSGEFGDRPRETGENEAVAGLSYFWKCLCLRCPASWVQGPGWQREDPHVYFGPFRQLGSGVKALFPSRGCKD